MNGSTFPRNIGFEERHVKYRVDTPIRREGQACSVGTDHVSDEKGAHEFRIELTLSLTREAKVFRRKEDMLSCRK
jgi:hypothetical protein